jgi:hypothetical protein
MAVETLMAYRDPDTGRFITKEHWYEIQREELPEPDYPDDEYDWDFDFEEGSYDDEGG